MAANLGIGRDDGPGRDACALTNLYIFSQMCLRVAKRPRLEKLSVSRRNPFNNIPAQGIRSESSDVLRGKVL